MWGIDILGPLPMSRGQCKFVVIAIDYITKWAKVEALARITDQKVKNFIWRCIVYRFEITHAIVSTLTITSSIASTLTYRSSNPTPAQSIHKRRSPSEPSFAT